MQKSDVRKAKGLEIKGKRRMETGGRKKEIYHRLLRLSRIKSKKESE